MALFRVSTMSLGFRSCKCARAMPGSHPLALSASGLGRVNGLFLDILRYILFFNADLFLLLFVIFRFFYLDKIKIGYIMV